MLKLLHSHNDVFLEMLRSRRESLQLRQRDVAKLVGRGQATVSKVEAGARRLDVIELRTWLCALGVDFVAFIEELEQRLRTHSVAREHLLSRRPMVPSPRRHPTHKPRRRA
jgi:transcriptional regulator with XRE-family HTH domain